MIRNALVHCHKNDAYWVLTIATMHILPWSFRPRSRQGVLGVEGLELAEMHHFALVLYCHMNYLSNRQWSLNHVNLPLPVFCLCQYPAEWVLPEALLKLLMHSRVTSVLYPMGHFQTACYIDGCPVHRSTSELYFAFLPICATVLSQISSIYPIIKDLAFRITNLALNIDNL